MIVNENFFLISVPWSLVRMDRKDIVSKNRSHRVISCSGCDTWVRIMRNLGGWVPSSVSVPSDLDEDMSKGFGVIGYLC